jgi:hypothetical protein
MATLGIPGVMRQRMRLLRHVPKHEHVYAGTQAGSAELALGARALSLGFQKKGQWNPE